MAQLVRAPARRVAALGLNSGPGENFSLNLLMFALVKEIDFYFGKKDEKCGIIQ